MLFFFFLHQNSRWLTKMAGKQYLGKVADDSVCTPWVKHFQNHCLAPFPRFMHFRFLRRNSTWPQNWLEINFWKRVPNNSMCTPWVKNSVKFAPFPKFKIPDKMVEKQFLHKTLSKSLYLKLFPLPYCVLCRNKDGCQKWRKNNFYQNLADHCVGQNVLSKLLYVTLFLRY